MYNNIGNLINLPADVDLNFFINSFDAKKYQSGAGFRCKYPSLDNNYPSTTPGYLFLWRDDRMLKLYYITRQSTFTSGKVYTQSGINRLRWHEIMDSGMTISVREENRPSLVTEKEFKDLVDKYITQYNDKELWDMLKPKLTKTKLMEYASKNNPSINRTKSTTPLVPGEIVASSGVHSSGLIVAANTRIGATSGRGGKPYMTPPKTTLFSENLLDKTNPATPKHWTDAYDDYKTSAAVETDDSYDTMLLASTQKNNYRYTDDQMKIHMHYGGPSKHITKHILASPNRLYHQYNTELVPPMDIRLAVFDDMQWKLLYDGADPNVKTLAAPAGAREIMVQFATNLGDLEGQVVGYAPPLNVPDFHFWMYTRYREFQYLVGPAGTLGYYWIYNSLVSLHHVTAATWGPILIGGAPSIGGSAWRVAAPKVTTKRPDPNAQRDTLGHPLWIRRMWYR